MAIKQRALMKLDMTKKHVLHVMRTWNKAALGEVYRDLTEARDLYREGLPRSGYAAYGEIYDGLILAVQKVMEGGEADFQEEVLALCQELLEHLERETAKETRFKKEIFFLPYKLSMFDSLESVWRAADEDKEHCNAYVMPIPYADRNPDQTVAAWHCERDQFPKDVPTLDWQQVDLKVWHPDIVVYHSPYDDCNTVTSVDEQYYSRNLRYCAEKLVYIPYFVLDEIEPGDEGAEEGIAHFILAPGVLNADLIVVQSEKMRQVYINVLSRYTNQGEEYWQAHVSGAGSPKIEKVLMSKKEDFEMPEKWRQLVEGKKVILYNTSIAAMLQHSDKVCDKLRYVFDVFRNRDDVVLWWRPHPLMKATFHSMRPQFEEEYLALEKQYIEEGWGIYDDSPDLHRAICWSDAYYGDMSSVVALYRATKKQAMIETLSSSYELLSFVRYDACPERIKVLPLFGTIICDVQWKSGDVIAKTLKRSKDCSLDGEWGGFIQLEEKLIFYPYQGKNFLEYDLVNGYQRLISCDEIGVPSRYKFSESYCWENKIFFICANYPLLLVYDGTKRTYRRLDILEKNMAVNSNTGICSCCRMGKDLFLLLNESKRLLNVDMVTEAVTSHLLDSEKYQLITSGDDLIWLSDDKAMYCLNVEASRMTGFQYPIGDMGKMFHVRCIQYIQGMVWVFYLRADASSHVIHFDTSKKIFLKTIDLSDLGYVGDKVEPCDNQILYLSSVKDGTGYIHGIDLVTMKIESRKLLLNRWEAIRLQKFGMKEAESDGYGSMQKEIPEIFSLKTFVDVISQLGINESTAKINGMQGKSIYDFITEEIR